MASAEGGTAAEDYAQAALDLALQLLSLWCAVGRPELAVAWGAALAADSVSISMLAPPSDAGGEKPLNTVTNPDIAWTKAPHSDKCLR